MLYLYSVLFGIAIGAAGFVAALIARKHPEMKLFGKYVQTERVMDVAFLLFLSAVLFVRLCFLPSAAELGLVRTILSIAIALVVAVLILWLGYRLILQKKYPEKRPGDPGDPRTDN